VRSPYFLAVRAVVNREDPIGLIAMDAPEDEYDPEVEDLVKWRRPVTAARVAEVFLHWFGSGTGEISDDEAARIAAGINRARLEHMPR